MCLFERTLVRGGKVPICISERSDPRSFFGTPDVPPCSSSKQRAPLGMNLAYFMHKLPFGARRGPAKGPQLKSTHPRRQCIIVKCGFHHHTHSVLSRGHTTFKIRASEREREKCVPRQRTSCSLRSHTRGIIPRLGPTLLHIALWKR